MASNIENKVLKEQFDKLQKQQQEKMMKRKQMKGDKGPAQKPGTSDAFGINDDLDLKVFVRFT